MSVAVQIDAAAVFLRWWQMRDLPNDRAVLAAAVEAGSVARSGGMLWLTDRGKQLRQEGIRLRRRTALRSPSR